MRGVQNAAGVVEAKEEAGSAARARTTVQSLTAGRVANTGGEMLAAQQLAANRTSEQFIRAVTRRPNETRQQARWQDSSDIGNLGRRGLAVGTMPHATPSPPTRDSQDSPAQRAWLGSFERLMIVGWRRTG